MYYRQTKDTFIRKYGKFGYITNQRNRQDFVFNEIGADFLDQIKRDPQNINNAVNSLLELYDNATYNQLAKDFKDFLAYLNDYEMIVMSSNINQLDDLEPYFAYDKFSASKTTKSNFVKPIEIENYDFSLREYFKKYPQIFGLQIELTSRCNERCIHCYIPNSKKDNGIDINSKLLFRILDQAFQQNTIQLTISGGEPLLHPDINEFLLYARKLDFSISILSNLTNLNESHINTFKSINPSVIQASLYSMNPEEHDTITNVKGSFIKTKNAIERLIKENIPVQISCPVLAINKDSYKDVLIYAQKNKIKAQTDFIIMAQADFNTSNLENRIKIDDASRLINDIIHYDKDYKTILLNNTKNDEDIEEIKKSPICGVGLDSICVASNGDYYPCAGWQGMVVGNANKNNLDYIWAHSSKLNELRSITYNDFPQCFTCSARDYCSLCLARNYNENRGNYLEVSEYFCAMTKLNKKIAEIYKNESKNHKL
jgi:radical SAM protein with 4Fe4S-binding SPASM domain